MSLDDARLALVEHLTAARELADAIYDTRARELSAHLAAAYELAAELQAADDQGPPPIPPALNG
jgi:hypothetical protein